MSSVPSYDIFAPFYDAVQGDRAEQVSLLRSLIEKHHPTATSVLELACGTGSVIQQLQPRYRVTGVDISPRMLELAAAKVPTARLFHDDITRVSLSERFDVVLCVYDSINHLLAFEAWEAVFDRARDHLNERGILIFDINTQHQLTTFITQPAWTHWFDGNLLVMDVTDGGGGVSVWRIAVFEHLGDSAYTLHSEDIREVSFPVQRVKTALNSRYAHVTAYDARRSRPSSRSDRLYFVCRN